MTDRISPIDVAGRDIRHGDLRALSCLVGTGYRAVGREPDAQATMARGSFALRQLRPGLLVHASDARYQQTLTTQLVKQRSLNLSIVVRGGWQATLGDMPLACGGQSAQQAHATAFVLSETDLWRKQAVRGGHARMVNVMVSPEWLEAGSFGDGRADALPIQRLTRQHRWAGSWRPSGLSVAAAEQILAVPRYVGPLQDLLLESRAIDIVIDALAILTDQPSAPARVHAADHRRLQLVRERLDAAKGEIPSLAALARDAGLSTRSLQRQFALVHGIGVVDYARHRRLDLARELLEREGATVAQAAYRAGYAHSANFATAFKRRFGLSPHHVRARA
jgi:AraC-like DNA-binding protein